MNFVGIWAELSKEKAVFSSKKRHEVEYAERYLWT
jgi:hypothetical protein